MGEVSSSSLAEAAARVLEDGAFLFTEPADEPPALQDDVVTARIRFEGPGEGFLQVTMPTQGCTMLAANMLGVDPEDDDAAARGRDALGEILNILCGALLGEAFPDSAEIKMGLPYVAEGREVPADPKGQDAKATLLAEDGFAIEVAFRIAGDAP